MARRQYPFHLIEPKWQQRWDAEQTFRAWNPGDTIPANHPFAARHGLTGKTPSASDLPPKFYILDMFPYPSGAGLHVGHPEGYTATDILARYRRARGFNVLHPMGWDSFGLPAEQYAVKTGQHPRKTTEANIANFTRQIKSLGFSYDWTRELATTDPEYFRWTQWIFLQLYNAWFNPSTNKAEPISELSYPAACDTEDKKRAYRDSKRLAYVSEAPVNWCPELGTVLANEEVIDGKSEVGGFPVIRRPMKQWMLRITAFAERLLDDLDTIEWSDSLKEMQRNWIGRSEGAEVIFKVEGTNKAITVFTTRPDTLFGATFLVLAPDHPLIAPQPEGIIPQVWPDDPEIFDRTPNSRPSPSVPSYPLKGDFHGDWPWHAVRSCRDWVSTKSERDRGIAKEKTGTPTGAFAINPVNGKRIPIWIADYVLATYGTGAIMAVPAHDERDLEFAQKPTNRLQVLPVIQSPHNEDPIGYCGEGIAINSANSEISLNGLPTAEAKAKITAWLETKGLGRKTVNYKLRDWLFSRQRYWGEPFPIVWKRAAAGNLQHEALPESALPLLPPPLDDYKPTADGQPPLARARDWVALPDSSIRETNTMPQWAGSCWYYLRYTDIQNTAAFVSPEAESYWMGTASSKLQVAGCKSDADVTQPSTFNLQPSTATPGVDLYVGGTEHAVLHLLYARFWHKVLFDLGHVSTAEPFFKLVNQGLILGEDGQKMSKSRGNVVNPDDVLAEFGADAFRLYEMFMGPLQDVKPWNTRGVEGVYRFLGRVWRLFVDEKSETDYEQNTTVEPQREAEFVAAIKLNPALQDIAPTPPQLKALHACIKKVTEDLDGLRFNTAISTMMIFVNEAMTWPVKPWSVMRDFLQLLAPFAPHLAEELWEKTSLARGPARKLGTDGAAATSDMEPATLDSLSYSPWPKFDPALLVEDTLEIPVQVNGKLRDVIRVPATATNAELEAAARVAENAQPFLTGKTVKKVIVVPKKLVNLIAA